MKQSFFSLLLAISIAFTAKAQLLSEFKVTMQAGQASYLSLDNKTAYAEGQAVAVKTKLDLVLMADSSKQLIEWYNLRTENDNLPAGVTGTRTGIVGISFDKDQFEKCRSRNDLDRMTGHITANSFSHFAVISEGDHTRYSCFLLRRENGSKVLMWVEAAANGKLSVTVKM